MLMQDSRRQQHQAITLALELLQQKQLPRQRKNGTAMPVESHRGRHAAVHQPAMTANIRPERHQRVQRALRRVVQARQVAHQPVTQQRRELCAGRGVCLAPSATEKASRCIVAADISGSRRHSNRMQRI